MVDYNSLEPGMAYWEPTSPIDPEEVRAAIMSRVQDRSSIYHPYGPDANMFASPRLRALLNDVRPTGVLAGTVPRARREQSMDYSQLIGDLRGNNRLPILSRPDTKLEYALEDIINPPKMMYMQGKLPYGR